MKLCEFEAVILAADPTATHYTGVGDNLIYTIWAEYGEEAEGADDAREKLFDRIQVDHYTDIEYSPMKDTISAALEAAGIPYRYRCYYEKDEKAGSQWIHHIWDCEVW